MPNRIDHKGFTITEMVISMLITSLVFAGLIHQLRASIEQARDHQQRLETFVQAQAVMQTIGAELRMAGNGVPFDQKNFVIDDIRLSDPTVAQPLLVAECTSNKVAIRVNESGEVFLVTSDFNPAAGLTVSLTSVDSLEVNDPIYLSNSVISGDDGLYGVVGAVSRLSKIITLNAGYVASPGAVFRAGSTLEEVPVVTYQNLGPDVVRDSGFGSVILGPNSIVSFKYYDMDENEIELPMAAMDLVTRLRSVEISVTLRSQKPLSTTNQPYTAQVTQRIGIRNLDYLL